MSIWKETKKVVPGFISAGLFDREGMIIEGYSDDPNFHLEHAAAAFVTLVNEADTAGNLIELDNALEVQLTFKDAYIVLRSISNSENGMIIGLASSKDTVLGRVRMGMDFLMKKIMHSGTQSSVTKMPSKISG